MSAKTCSDCQLFKSRERKRNGAYITETYCEYTMVTANPAMTACFFYRSSFDGCFPKSPQTIRQEIAEDV